MISVPWKKTHIGGQDEFQVDQPKEAQCFSLRLRHSYCQLFHFQSF